MNCICSTCIAQRRTAEHLLAEEGVYAGFHGLRGLAECNEFWDGQMYGTRLYYGPGGGQYLHRSVLEAAIKALDRAAARNREGTAP